MEFSSNVRKNFSQDEPVNSAYVAYRGTLPIEEVSDDADMDDVIMWIGPNCHVVQYQYVVENYTIK